MKILLISLGGSLGALSRFYLAEALNKLAREHNVKVECIGHTAEENIEIKDIGKISIHALKTSHEDWFQNFTK